MPTLSPGPPPSFTPRYIRATVETALLDTRVVFVAGPRQSGKTTFLRLLAGADRPFITLDDAATLDAARTDPVGFVRGLDIAAIDEVQRAPGLMLAIKESVDKNPAPGRFLLSGSANITTLPVVGDSLAGRMEVVSLLPFAQAEMRSGTGQFLDRVFAGDRLDAGNAPIIGEALQEAVLSGGYPEAIRRSTPARRRAWFDNYLALILDRDVREIARIDHLTRVPKLFSLLAEHSGSLVNHSSFGAALGLSAPTAQTYIGVLERLFLLRTLPAWSNNRVSRLVKTPKLHLLDSGLLASVRDDSALRLRSERTRYGALLETFVLAEILKLASWSEARVSLFHCRTKDGDEVDFVLEDRQGRIVGIEVKASATVTGHDVRGLRYLKALAGDRFVRGIVLHDHDRVTPFDSDLHAAPVSTLWTM